MANPTEDDLAAAGYEPVCALDEVPPMMPRRVQAGGRSMLVCRAGDTVFALDEICPHKHKSMAFGIVHQGTLTCPHHMYPFELDTGRCRRRRCPPVQTYDAAVAGGRVWIKPPPSPNLDEPG